MSVARTELLVALAGTIVIGFVAVVAGAPAASSIALAAAPPLASLGARRPLGVALAAAAAVAAVVLVLGGLDGARVAVGVVALPAVVAAASTAADGLRAAERAGKRRLNDLGTLLRAADVLSALKDDDAPGSTVAALALEVLGGDGAVVVEMSDGARITSRVAWPVSDDPRVEPAAVVAARRAAGARRPLVVDIDEAHGAHDLLAVPMQVDGDHVVAVAVVAVAPGRADDALLDLATVFGRQAGSTMHRIAGLQRIADAALRDPLTGVGNRRALDAVLAQLRPGDAVMICDLDHFKSVNDTDGHAAGDKVLVAFAQHLRRAIGTEDVVGRWGGEEFLVVLRSAHHRALERATELLEGWRTTGPRTTFSAGVTLATRGVSAEALVEEADAALYRAKREGRDQVMADPSLAGDGPVTDDTGTSGPAPSTNPVTPRPGADGTAEQGTR